MSTPENHAASPEKTIITAPSINWKNNKVKTAIAVLSAGVVLPLGAVLYSREDTDAKAQKHADAPVAQKPHEEVHPVIPVAPLPAVEKHVEPELSIVEWKEVAVARWEQAHTALSASSVDQNLQDMQKALQHIACTHEDIGVTPEKIRQCYLAVAKNEWERVQYFKGVGTQFLQPGAVSEMQKALEKAGASLADIGVTEAMLKDATTWN